MSVDGKLVEIKRQLRLRGGYPYDLDKLESALQRIIEGDFDSRLEVKLAESRPAPVPVPAPLRFKKIDEHTLEVYNDVPSQLPFGTAERTWNVVKPGTVIFTWQGTGKDQILLRDGVIVTPYVNPVQEVEGGIAGQVLWDKKLKAMPGHSSVNERDALKANPEFIPESWKTAGAIFFWGEGFRSPVNDEVCVYYLDWSGQGWYVYYDWLSSQWSGDCPAAVSASPSTVT